MHFQVFTLPPPVFPFRAHHTLNSNTPCCGALISSYMLYANTVSHHRVLLGSVSRVGLMVRCFKNSLSARTENNSNTPPCIISQPSCGYPADYLLRSIRKPLRGSSCGSKHYFQDVYMTPACKNHHTCTSWLEISCYFFFVLFFTLPTPLFPSLSRKLTLTPSHPSCLSSKSPPPPPTSWTAALRKA